MIYDCGAATRGLSASRLWNGGNGGAGDVGGAAFRGVLD